MKITKQDLMHLIKEELSEATPRGMRNITKDTKLSDLAPVHPKRSQYGTSSGEEEMVSMDSDTEGRFYSVDVDADIRVYANSMQEFKRRIDRLKEVPPDQTLDIVYKSDKKLPNAKLVIDASGKVDLQASKTGGVVPELNPESPETSEKPSETPSQKSDDWDDLMSVNVSPTPRPKIKEGKVMITEQYIKQVINEEIQAMVDEGYLSTLLGKQLSSLASGAKETFNNAVTATKRNLKDTQKQVLDDIVTKAKNDAKVEIQKVINKHTMNAVNKGLPNADDLMKTILSAIMDEMTKPEVLPAPPGGIPQSPAAGAGISGARSAMAGIKSESTGE